jgi:hypothetical protein
MRRILNLVLVVLVGSAGVLYGFDYVSARYAIPKRQMFDDVRVDQLYTAPNKYGEIEWSRGDPVMERCVNSLFPHFGFNPCWYVKRHTMNTNKTG